eukprot:UN11839
MLYFLLLEAFKTNCLNHVIRNNFKNIFRHVEMVDHISKSALPRKFGFKTSEMIIAKRENLPFSVAK